MLAEPVVTKDAEVVVTCGSGVEVWKVPFAPVVVPTEFVAETRY